MSNIVNLLLIVLIILLLYNIYNYVYKNKSTHYSYKERFGGSDYSNFFWGFSNYDGWPY